MRVSPVDTGATVDECTTEEVWGTVGVKDRYLSW